MESQTKLSRREKTGMVMRHLRGCWGFFTGAIALAWMNTACNALVPQIISFTVDSVLGGEAPDLPGFLRPLAPLDRLRADPLPFLWLAAGAVVLAAAVRGVCIYGMRVNLSKGSEGFVKSLRDGLYGHIQRLSFEWHTAHATGDIIQRCTSDVEVIRTFVCNQLMEVVRTVFLIALYTVIMLQMNWQLALVVILVVPAIAALNEEGDEVKEMVKEYQRRRDYAVKAINEIPGLHCECPKGAFYIFINCKSLNMKSADLSAYLLEEAKIALVPGDVFGPGGEGYLRMSFANSYENVVEGCAQLKKAVALLQQKP